MLICPDTHLLIGGRVIHFCSTLNFQLPLTAFSPHPPGALGEIHFLRGQHRRRSSSPISEKMSGWQIIRSECQHFMRKLRRQHLHYRPMLEQECFLFGYRKHNATIPALAWLATAAMQAASLLLAVRSHTMRNARLSYRSVKLQHLCFAMWGIRRHTKFAVLPLALCWT